MATTDMVFGTFDYSTSTDHVVYTVPAGRKAVVWEFAAMELVAGAHEIDLYVLSGGAHFFLAVDTAVGYVGVVRYSGRRVLEAGDSLRVWQSSPSRANGYACGYEIS